ncbi:MAG: hypothetical protein AB8B55_17055 [Mariniblastus sp.]
MTDNPFVAPASGGKPGGQPAGVAAMPVPGAVMPICIICLLLGLVGFLGACAQGVLIPFQASLETMVDQMPGGTMEQRVFQRMNMDAQKLVLIPYIVLLVVNLFVGAALFIASILGLQRKEGGRKLLSFALVAAIFYGLLKIGVTIYGYLTTTSAMASSVDHYVGEAPVDKLQQLFQLTKMFAAIGVGVGCVMAVALIAFYVWARIYMNKPHVVEYFQQTKVA